MKPHSPFRNPFAPPSASNAVARNGMDDSASSPPSSRGRNPFSPPPDDGWRPTLLSESLPDSFSVGPCPNCQGHLSFKEFKDFKVEEDGRTALFHCDNCNSDVAPVITVEAQRPRRSHKRRAPLVFGGTIEEARSWLHAILRLAICPNCGREGLRTKNRRARRLLADGLEQPHCGGCKRDVPVDVAAQSALDIMKANPSGVAPDSLRFIEGVVAFIRDAHSTGAQHAN